MFKKFNFSLLSLLAVVVIVCSGCSTIQTHKGSGDYVRPYIGTSHAIQKAKRVWNNYDYEYYGIFELHALDVPACFILDTIILPYDLYRYLTYKPSESINSAD